jgi:hypothetical protein
VIAIGHFILHVRQLVVESGCVMAHGTSIVPIIFAKSRYTNVLRSKKTEQAVGYTNQSYARQCFVLPPSPSKMPFICTNNFVITQRPFYFYYYELKKQILYILAIKHLRNNTEHRHPN